MIRHSIVLNRLHEARQLRLRAGDHGDRIPNVAEEFDQEVYEHDREFRRQLRRVESDIASIADIPEPMLDVQLLAVDHDPHTLRLMTAPSAQARLLAVSLDPTTIKYIPKPTNQEVYIALSQDPSTYDLFTPTATHFFIWLFLCHKFIWP
jgi:hypothetical protein